MKQNYNFRATACDVHLCQYRPNLPHCVGDHPGHYHRYSGRRCGRTQILRFIMLLWFFPETPE